MTSLLNIAGNIPVSAAAEAGQSLRFENGDNAYLNWTPSTNGSSLTQTLSFWMKRTSEGNYIFRASEFYLYLSGDNLNYYDWRQGANGLILQTSAVYRDVSAWMHVVLTQDRGNATASNRIKLYVNGEQVTSFSTATYPNQNEGSYFNNSGNTHYISHPSTNQYDGYLANVAFIDGQALDPTSFGEYQDTLWKPKPDTDIQALTFGTNGFYLPFKQTTEAEGFSTVTYIGNGGTQGIEGVGFEPDFVWIKERSDTSPHALFDSVRGVGNSLQSDNTGSEITATDSLTSFDSNGFSLGDNTEAGADINYTSGSNYVAWCWDAGSGSAVSNTDGSITSTVKANTAKGFSIVSYTGTGSLGTVGHGLSSTPEFIVFKRRNATSNWISYNSTSGSSNALYLDLTNANTATTYMNSTDPTASVFTVNTNTDSNASGGTYIAYCFHSVSGYSDIGSYTGDGTSNGSKSINLGFKPAFVMIKRTNDTENWMMLDTTRNPSGIINNNLYANLSNAESDYDRIEATSTGFDIYSNFNDINASGSTYIYMAFADTRDATFFGDTSGNSNNWTPNALNNTDVVPDSPVSGGNFATYNSALNSSMVLSEGNLEATQASAAWATTAATFAVSSGKWYWESKNTGGNYQMIGIVSDSFNSYASYAGVTADSYSYYPFSGQASSFKFNNNVATVYGNIGTTGDIFGVALDLDAGTLEFFKNNVSQGVAFTGLSGTFSPALSHNTSDSISNFGQDSSFAGTKTPQGNTDDNGVGDFYYAPPSGFLCLKTSSLPTPTITAPDEYFNTVLYTGTGSSLSVTGANFQPDWTWIKKRSAAENHALYDVVRGTTNRLQSNVTTAENTGGLTSFDSDGFTVDGAYGTDGESGATYVAWNWLAGNGTVSNTDGSITSTVSANTDAGFSIVNYTADGTTTSNVGHGLSSAPEIVIHKSRDGASNWFVNTTVVDGSNDYLFLNTTAAKANWSQASPTPSVFTSWNVPNGDEVIAYCFHSVESYSKIGTYTGNGSTDGTFVHCGFRPAWIMFKRTDSTSSWYILDNKRNGFNPDNTELSPESSAVEADYDRLDFVSNGFKHRQSFSGSNGSGATYIFLAFAEAPFKSANAR